MSGTVELLDIALGIARRGWPVFPAPAGHEAARPARREELPRNYGLLYDPADLAAKRVATPAQLRALARALAARRHCPRCRRDVGYCVPTSLGACIDCHDTQVTR
ncbi:hypothetical protein [Pseudonocardia sp. MH-G8]|uniref:hypothetical protein n=1 Tax=Pseudonocardia sp. MH-G8 TaxID=1854588 RepID=UPI0018E92DA5|nr:hypothetical protein [Pseudonocardia sp. MH-G8]